MALTGIVLTRVDGDGRGGAALSMRAVTGKPIKLIGVGEKLDALEDFYPERIAGRILGMGDVVGLVEKAMQHVELDKAEAMARKVKKGAFDLDDLSEQLAQMQKLGGMGGVLAMLPGIGKVKKQLDAANLDDRILKRQQAMIGSMTKAERTQPEDPRCQAQEARRGGLRHIGAGHQPAGEDAPADGRHDEGDGQEARHLQPDVRIGRRLRCRPSCPLAPHCPPVACHRCRRAAFRVWAEGCRVGSLACPAHPAAFPACRVPRNDEINLNRRTKPCH